VKRIRDSSFTTSQDIKHIAILRQIKKALKGILILIFILISGVFICNAQSTGPQTPTSFAFSGYGVSWANLGGVHAVDNSPAYVDLAQFPNCGGAFCYYSNLANFSNFAFSIPSNATIAGIILEANQRVSSPGGGIRDSVMLLALNGTALGSDHSDPSYWLDTPTMNSYGDSTDTWGYSWTPAEINDIGFGLLYRVTNDSYDQPASLDYLAMTIYYQSGTGISVQKSTPWNIGFYENSLIISAEASILAKGVKIEVRQIDGKLKYFYDAASGNSKLDLRVDVSSWATGVYLVTIVSAEGASIQRKAILSKN